MSFVRKPAWLAIVMGSAIGVCLGAACGSETSSTPTGTGTPTTTDTTTSGGGGVGGSSGTGAAGATGGSTTTDGGLPDGFDLPDGWGLPDGLGGECAECLQTLCADDLAACYENPDCVAGFECALGDCLVGSIDAGDLDGGIDMACVAECFPTLQSQLQGIAALQCVVLTCGPDCRPGILDAG